MADGSAPAATSNDADVDFSTLLPKNRVQDIVKEWINDDMPSFDVGGLVVGTSVSKARLFMKSPGIFAGKPFFDAVFECLGDCQVDWSNQFKEGEFIKASGTTKVCLATVTGPANLVLRGERTALNTLSRCSGIATISNEAVTKARSLGWKGHVAGTRKTTPGFRLAEKYALLVGGAATHRLDLSQMVMLKDNHINAVGGSITSAVQLARKAAGFSQKIEVECPGLEQAMEAAQAGADVIMLDNYDENTGQLHADAKMIKEKYPHVIIEASGGITVETMPNYLGEHVDVISRSFVQGYPTVDFSLKIE